MKLPIVDNRFTNSRRQVLMKCPRKHYYQYELGLRREREAQPLRFGSNFHLGADVRRRGASIEEASQAALMQYGELPAWVKDEAAMTEWATEREMCDRLLRAYWWYWESRQMFEVVESEMQFEIPLINPETGRASSTFTLAGKIDGIVKMLPDGPLAVLESKTTSDRIHMEPGDPYPFFWERLRFDGQISTYVIAARRMGYDVTTVLYDVTKKATTRPSRLTIAECGRFFDSGEYYGEQFTLTGTGTEMKVDGVPVEVVATAKNATIRETPAMWGARLNAEIAEAPERYFQRRQIARTEADLREFEAELWDEQKTLADRRRHGRWTRNDRACAVMGKCEFLKFCANGLPADGSVPEGFVQVENVHGELEEVEVECAV